MNTQRTPFQQITQKDDMISLHWDTVKDTIMEKTDMVGNAYRTSPLYGTSRRGSILERAGFILDIRRGYTLRDAPDGVRGRSNSAWDWERQVEGKWLRVEHKSAMLGYNHRTGWNLKFDGIKADHFDVLLICAYTPRGCEWFECPCVPQWFGTQGKTRHWTRLGPFSGGKNRLRWDTAWVVIRDKLIQKGAVPVGTMPWGARKRKREEDCLANDSRASKRPSCGSFKRGYTSCFGNQKVPPYFQRVTAQSPTHGGGLPKGDSPRGLGTPQGGLGVSLGDPPLGTP